MARSWHILFCDAQIRSCPVSEFIESCPPKHQVKILRFLDLLESQGPILPRPYADLLVDGIHELRIKLSGDQIRLLYFFAHQKFIVLYYAFVKNSRKVPEKFIRKVVEYREQFMQTVPKDHLEDMIRVQI